MKTTQKKTIEKKNSTKKKEIVACLDCRRNHRKCDGSRPCYHCKRNKVECLENNKRKPIGRPKKTNEKKIKTSQNNVLISFEMISCLNCEVPQEIDARFCNQCGSRIPRKEDIPLLLSELEKLRKRNESLTQTLKLRTSTGKNFIFYFLILKITSF